MHGVYSGSTDVGSRNGRHASGGLLESAGRPRLAWSRRCCRMVWREIQEPVPGWRHRGGLDGAGAVPRPGCFCSPGQLPGLRKCGRGLERVTTGLSGCRLLDVLAPSASQSGALVFFAVDWRTAKLLALRMAVGLSIGPALCACAESLMRVLLDQEGVCKGFLAWQLCG